MPSVSIQSAYTSKLHPYLFSIPALCKNVTQKGPKSLSLLHLRENKRTVILILDSRFNVLLAQRPSSYSSHPRAQSTSPRSAHLRHSPYAMHPLDNRNGLESILEPRIALLLTPLTIKCFKCIMHLTHDASRSAAHTQPPHRNMGMIYYAATLQ